MLEKFSVRHMYTSDHLSERLACRTVAKPLIICEGLTFVVFEIEWTLDLVTKAKSVEKSRAQIILGFQLVIDLYIYLSAGVGEIRLQHPKMQVRSLCYVAVIRQ